MKSANLPNRLNACACDRCTLTKEMLMLAEVFDAQPVNESMPTMPSFRSTALRRLVRQAVVRGYRAEISADVCRVFSYMKLLPDNRIKMQADTNWFAIRL